MSGHAPYLMPNGGHLGTFLKGTDAPSEAGDYGARRKARKGSTTKRGKVRPMPLMLLSASSGPSVDGSTWGEQLRMLASSCGPPPGAICFEQQAEPGHPPQVQDLVFAHVIQHNQKLRQAGASDPAALAELAELRALEAVGARRRCVLM